MPRESFRPRAPGSYRNEHQEEDQRIESYLSSYRHKGRGYARPYVLVSVDRFPADQILDDARYRTAQNGPPSHTTTPASLGRDASARGPASYSHPTTMAQSYAHIPPCPPYSDVYRSLADPNFRPRPDHVPETRSRVDTEPSRYDLSRSAGRIRFRPLLPPTHPCSNSPADTTPYYPEFRHPVDRPPSPASDEEAASLSGYLGSDELELRDLTIADSVGFEEKRDVDKVCRSAVERPGRDLAVMEDEDEAGSGPVRTEYPYRHGRDGQRS